MRVISKIKVKVKDLKPGMFVKTGARSHWTVEHNFGWRLYGSPNRHDTMAQVITFTRAGGVLFVWAYHNRNTEVEVVVYDVEPKVAPFYEEYDDRSPWI